MILLVVLKSTPYLATKFTDITIEGLENGTPYYVSVLTVDLDYTSPAPKSTLLQISRGTPPIITSSPSDKATVMNGIIDQFSLTEMNITRKLLMI